MIKPRVVITTFLSGGKGGAGTSTITVNTGVALSEALNTHILIVDMSYGANATATKLLGLDPGTVGIYDYIFNNAQAKPLKVNDYRIYLLPNGAKDPNQIAYELARQFVGKPDQFTRMLGIRLRDFIIRTAVSLGVNYVLIDLPSTAVGAHSFAVIATSDIINIVARAGVTHIGEAREAYSLTEFNTRAIVNVIVNGVLPDKGDTTANFKGLNRNGGFIMPLAFSPYVMLITDYKRDIALAYDFKDQWRSDFERFIKSLIKQLGIALRSTS